MPDNISTGADGRIWVAIVSPVNAAAEGLTPRAAALRKLLWRLPARLQPKVQPEVWAVAFDPDSGEAVAGIRTKPVGFGMVTGIVEAGGRLWMGRPSSSTAVAHMRTVPRPWATFVTPATPVTAWLPEIAPAIA